MRNTHFVKNVTYWDLVRRVYVRQIGVCGRQYRFIRASEPCGVCVEFAVDLAYAFNCSFIGCWVSCIEAGRTVVRVTESRERHLNPREQRS